MGSKSLLRIVAVILLVCFSAAAAFADVNAVFDELTPKGDDAKAMVRTITDNVEAWFVRWHMIENAKKSLVLTYFIVEDDCFGRSMIGLLLKKAKEGINIRFMVDARGTKGLSRKFLGQDFLQELAAYDNVEIKVFNPYHIGILNIVRDLRQPMTSNHDKLIIADGEWVITGGRNISRNYFGDPEDDPDVFRDTDVLLKGKMVAGQALAAFDAEWAMMRNYKVGGDLFGNWDSEARTLELARRAVQRHIMGFKPVDASKTSFVEEQQALNDELAKYKKMRWYSSFKPFQGQRAYPAKIVDKTSLIAKKNELTGVLMDFIDACEEEIIIQNPYVVLTDEAEAALKRASARGVKILIVTNSPDSSDSVLTQALFVKDWKRILKELPTCRIFAFTGQNKLHAKVFVFDRKITVIGTYNMDPMSEQINSEEVAVIKEPTFARRNFHRIEKDMEDAIEYKVRVESDGSVVQVVGPSDHCKEKAMGIVNSLGILSFLRPLI